MERGKGARLHGQALGRCLKGDKMRKYKELTIRNPGKREQEGNRTESLVIPRYILDLDIFQDAFTLGMYIDLLGLANTRGVRYLWREWGLMKVCFLSSGQFSKSFQFFEKRWRISSKRLIKFWNDLEKADLLQKLEPEDVKDHEMTEWEKSFFSSLKGSFKGQFKPGIIETNIYKIPFDFFIPENAETVERTTERTTESLGNSRLESSSENQEENHETQDNLQSAGDDIWN